MTIFHVPVAGALAWLLAAVFLGSGLFNIAGPAAIKEGFVRWGYPAWWNLVTGALELLAAVLIALPAARIAGLALGILICIAAVATVARHKEYAHMAPGLVLIVLSGLDLALLAA